MKPTQDAIAAHDSRNGEALHSIAQEIADRLDWHRNDSVQAAFVIGSVSSGNADDVSDVDVVAVTDPVPSRGERLRRYQSIGCSNVMLDFFHSAAPVLASNVEAIDKVTYRSASVDLCYCSARQVQAYAFQDLIVLKPSRIIEELHGEIPVTGLGGEFVVDRITYDLRIIEVHRRRYLEHCQRADWLTIDLGLLLAAIRDVLMVLNGVWMYNKHSHSLWRRLAKTGAHGNHLIAAIEDIKGLDDRVQSPRKLAQIDYVLAGLRDLCFRNGVSVGNFYADNLNPVEDDRP